jgi:hypothetical protein
VWHYDRSKVLKQIIIIIIIIIKGFKHEIAVIAVVLAVRVIIGAWKIIDDGGQNFENRPSLSSTEQSSLALTHMT